MKISLPTRDDKGKSGRKARPNAPMDSLLGTRLGEFTIEECIGEGGMGVVYRAVHPLIGKQVAIKVLRSELDSEHLVHRLLTEARAVNSIKHPGIVDIFGFGSLPDERPYVTMELLQGRPLSDFLRSNRPMELASVVWVMDQALSALGAAHRAGVIHRDLKPANIFIVTGPTTPPAVKLVDFGIAKLMESRENPMTSEGTVLGTPEFMAPEQIRGARIGPTSDLYAMGVLLFQMLTGSRPFRGDPVQVMFAHMERTPPVPSSRVSGIPSTLDALVLNLLEKNPASRLSSAEAVREQLRRIPLSTAPHAPSIPTSAPDTEDTPTSETTFTSEALKALKGGWELAAAPEWWVAPVLLVFCLGATALRLQPAKIESEDPDSVSRQAGTRFEIALKQNRTSTAKPLAAPIAALEGPIVVEAKSTSAVVSEVEDAPTQRAIRERVALARPKARPLVLPPLPTLPRTNVSEQRLAQRLDKLVAELRKRTKGQDVAPDLTRKLVGLYTEAAKAETATDRMTVNQALDSWQEQLTARFPR
ncbi:serine/threonine-protein kinase [Corallococcus sp. M7]